MRYRSIALGLLLALPAFGQTNEEKLEKKMAKSFVKNVDWVTEFDKAKDKAAADGKLIFAYFTRSYDP